MYLTGKNGIRSMYGMNSIITGISSGFHDAAITKIRDGEIIFASHSERYSKIL